MKDNIHINDDPDTAAKKIAEDIPWFKTPKSRSKFKSKTKKQNKPKSGLKFKRPKRDYRDKILSVSEARRLHSGLVKVQGMITTLSEPTKMIRGIKTLCGICGYVSNETTYDVPYSVIPSNPNNGNSKSKAKCVQCGRAGTAVSNYDFTNAVMVDLKDLELAEIENLSVILFDEDTVNIHVGERVIVDGNLQIIPQAGKLPIFLLAFSIKYEEFQEITLAPNDIEEIKRFVSENGSKTVDKLTEMFAPSVIGYDHIKRGFLYCASSTSLDMKQPKIHVVLVSEPGLAKSTLIRKAVKLVPNSRYESGQGSTGKSLTSIIAREEDKKEVLRLGPIPLSKGGICAINEIGRMNPQDQSHFLDVMQEQEFTVNKYGKNVRVRSPTAIIASTNPISGEWKEKELIDLNEIPTIRPLIDRFDLIFAYRTDRDEKAVRKYAYAKSEMDDDPPNEADMEYLKKHIMYAKQYCPNPKFSEDAKSMIAEYYTKIATQFGSPRIRETVVKLARAIAKLKLKDIIDSYDATEAQQYFNAVLQQYQQQVIVTHSPRDATYNLCLLILRNHTYPITFEELVKTACSQSEQVARYVGNKYKLSQNKKLRPILDMLLNHSLVRAINHKPWTLKWTNNQAKDSIDNSTTSNNSSFSNNGNPNNLSDHSDHSALQKKTKSPKIRKTEHENNPSVTKKARSDRSDRSDRNPSASASSSLSYSYSCYYCEKAGKKFETNDENEYHKHGDKNHRNKPMYPNEGTMKKYGLKSQDKNWESKG